MIKDGFIHINLFGIYMNKIKILLSALVFSFVLNISGVVAYASDIVNFANFEIPGSKNETSVTGKQKNLYGPEVIGIIGTSYNRNIQFKIEDKDQGATADFQTLSVGSDPINYSIGKISGYAEALSISAVVTGEKTLYLRTAVNWFGSKTSYSGSWWLSQQDWESVNGSANVNDNEYVTIIN